MPSKKGKKKASERRSGEDHYLLLVRQGGRQKEMEAHFAVSTRRGNSSGGGEPPIKVKSLGNLWRPKKPRSRFLSSRRNRGLQTRMIVVEGRRPRSNQGVLPRLLGEEEAFCLRQPQHGFNRNIRTKLLRRKCSN